MKLLGVYFCSLLFPLVLTQLDFLRAEFFFFTMCHIDFKNI